jgi:hypothetical protein
VTDLQFDCGDCLPTEDDLILAVSDNFGQSPLYVINGVISMMEYRIDEDFPEDDIHRFPASISDLIPRGMVIYPKVPSPLVFPVKDVQRTLFWEAKNGDYWLMIRGFVRYRDIFNDRWDNSFCFVYNPSKYKKGFAGCPKYNGEELFNEEKPATSQQPRGPDIPPLPDIPQTRL